MEDMEHIFDFFETLADIQNQLQNGVTSSSAEWLFGAKVKPQKATFKELNVDLSCIDLPVQAGEWAAAMLFVTSILLDVWGSTSFCT